MSSDSKSNKFSRRKFVKGMGTGIIGSYVAAPGFTQISKKIEKVAEENKGKVLLSLKVNGKKIKRMIDPQTTLADFLRNDLELTGTKVVCNRGECGGCTVIMDGKAIYSCHTLALDAAGKDVTTIEGLMNGEELHPVQQAFAEHDGMQCGYCTPGQVMAAKAILLENPKPGRDEIVKGMSGNICRCAAYPKILESAIAAAEKNQ